MSRIGSYIPSLHRTAQFTAAATLLLIFMGGLVTSHGAGMSVPDWPNSYGYNMFTFPPSKWIGGIFYEHTHRLMGTVVGMLSIALVVIAWMKEPRRWVRWLTVGVLGAVILQGVLGGLRVVLVKLDLAIVHACFAQAFLCLTALVAVVTSRWWIESPNLSTNARDGRRLVGLAVACAVAIYVQLVLGAMMRHYQAGLAIPDFPLAYGKLIPPTNSQEVERARLWLLLGPDQINADVFEVTLPKIWLHFAHRIGALVVALIVLATAVKALRRQAPVGLRFLAMWLIALLIVQVTLGTLTVLWRKPADIASLHVAGGALLLMTTFVLLVRAMRLYSPRWRTTARGFEISNLKSTDNGTLVPI
jgi:cytochrome c oxidase assembly protein subunit 15